MLYYTISVFLSAFLIFQVQPMIAKYILPWFGGTSAVWSTVELFFQVLLTGGYAYAHWLSQPKTGHRRLVVHLALLGLVLLQLITLSRIWPSSITPDTSWEPHGGLTNPIWDIFRLLIISVGPAYFLLSANSPLMQVWFNRAQPRKSPYALYALSNFGSLLGLILYPISLDPSADHLFALFHLRFFLREMVFTAGFPDLIFYQQYCLCSNPLRRTGI
jgi:glucan phosphoethanolaminetransferase (alkaline phosphatase superfamily)